mmetsp:Transcript_1781/g.3597  ORF Transcript_1781/g.3597 Transcript_1781/m.3597 type:complete len:128 (-) Transcript_1781:20-403(-)
MATAMRRAATTWLPMAAEAARLDRCGKFAAEGRFFQELMQSTTQLGGRELSEVALPARPRPVVALPLFTVRGAPMGAGESGLGVVVELPAWGGVDHADAAMECKGKRQKGSWGHRRGRGGMHGKPAT